MLTNATVSTNFPGQPLLSLSSKACPRDAQARSQNKIYIHSPWPMALQQSGISHGHACSLQGAPFTQTGQALSAGHSPKEAPLLMVSMSPQSLSSKPESPYNPTFPTLTSRSVFPTLTLEERPTF